MDNLKYALRYDIRYIRKGSIEVPHPHSGFKWTVDVFYFEVPIDVQASHMPNTTTLPVTTYLFLTTF